MIKRIIIGIILNAAAIYVVTLVLPQVVVSGGLLGYAVIGFIVGLLNLLIRPILTFVSFPFMLVTAGLFIFVINAAILWLVTYILPIINIQDINLVIPNILDFLLASVIFTIVNGLEHWLFAPRKH